MPVKIEKFSEGLFFSCSSLEEVPFRIGITDLPDYLCAQCNSLKSIIFPEGIKSIGSKAFSNCENLAEFQKLDSKSRDEYIAIFKQNGLSIRQISRLTGVSFGIVRKKYD